MKEELTDFDIFQALDRTSVLINMVSETLGSVFIPEEDGGLDDVLPAVKTLQTTRKCSRESYGVVSATR